MSDYKEKIKHELKRFNVYRGHYNAITYDDVMKLRPVIFQDTENFYKNIYNHIKHKADVRQSTHGDFKASLGEVTNAKITDPYFKACFTDTLRKYTDYTNDRFFYAFELNNEYKPVHLGGDEGYIAKFKHLITFDELEAIEKLQLAVTFGYEIHERGGVDMATMTENNHNKFFKMWYACLLYQNDLRWNTAFLMRYDISSENADEGKTLFYKYHCRYNGNDNDEDDNSDSDNSDNDSEAGNDHTSDSDSDNSDNAGLYGMAYYAEEPTEQ